MKYSDHQRPVPLQKSPLLNPFAVSAGFLGRMVDLLHAMGHLYAVLDVFTCRFLPHWREDFEGSVASIQQMQVMGEGGETQLISRRRSRDGLAVFGGSFWYQDDCEIRSVFCRRFIPEYMRGKGARRFSLSNTIPSQNHQKLFNMDIKSKYLLFEIVV